MADNKHYSLFLFFIHTLLATLLLTLPWGVVLGPLGLLVQCAGGYWIAYLFWRGYKDGVEMRPILRPRD